MPHQLLLQQKETHCWQTQTKRKHPAPSADTNEFDEENLADLQIHETIEESSDSRNYDSEWDNQSCIIWANYLWWGKVEWGYWIINDICEEWMELCIPMPNCSRNVGTQSATNIWHLYATLPTIRVLNLYNKLIWIMRQKMKVQVYSRMDKEVTIQCIQQIYFIAWFLKIPPHSCIICSPTCRSVWGKSLGFLDFFVCNARKRSIHYHSTSY
jgi:hypothetical protein